ncbi:hypothetical protein GOP47_0021141 [Adiantum capillus-veneris]|uniref:Uncharacterized protein n=1 Tax=Adiantum capillus-veneris TaxID=13818 RepID=A0A9D4UCD5_ADICA|nr:hypothetical protein GOP47_0021141 [Adiantum capillus-veneris]
MTTPNTPAKTQSSFATVLGAPSKLDRITQLQATLDRVLEENFELKSHLSKLEEQFNSMVDLTTDKVKEVEAKVSQAHSTTIAQVKTCVTKEISEQKFQEDNALKVHIGGLPLQWCTVEDTLEEAIIKLNHIIEPVNIKPKNVAWINDTHHHVGREHCVLTFKNKEEQVKLLRQSQLLKETKLWIAKKLTMNQLKSKVSKLKKMNEARKKENGLSTEVAKRSSRNFEIPNRLSPQPTLRFLSSLLSYSTC